MEVVEFAEDLKRSGARTVLDLGCGAGRHSILLGKQGFQVVALDISETALKTLDGRLKAASIANVALVRHEMSDLPFIDESSVPTFSITGDRLRSTGRLERFDE